MNRKIDIQFNDITGKSHRFEGLRELLSFLKTEAKFWTKQRESIDSNQRSINTVLGFNTTLSSLVQTIEGWSDQIDSWDDHQLQSQIHSLQRPYFQHTASSWLWSGHPFIAPFMDCHRKHGNSVATAFLDYVTKNNAGNMNSDTFLGVMIGYEFLNQDSDILKRRNGEKVSLGHLRKQMEETTTQLIGEVELFKKDFSSWNQESRENWSSWLGEASSEHGDQQENQKNEFIDYMDGCRTRISELENTYQEKLRLEKPAQYWKDAAKKYGFQGGLWSLALIASLLLGIVYFSGFFTDWLKGQNIAVQLNTLQGVAIFGTILAVYAFLVRSLSRLTFSSFHLMRDAEEREQLAYVYLSLINENKIDNESRDIVLQALFSRSETGLLASESGPTMPGVSEIIKSASKLK